MGEDDRLTIIKVGGDDRERDAQVFEILSVENAVNQIAEAMIAGETEARNAPAADVAKFESAAGGDDASQRSAAGVGCAENAADARARDARNRYAILLENLKNAEMREPARKAAAESDSDAWPNGQWGCTVCGRTVVHVSRRECRNPACGGAIGLASRKTSTFVLLKIPHKKRVSEGTGVRPYYAGTPCVPFSVLER